MDVKDVHNEKADPVTEKPAYRWEELRTLSLQPGGFGPERVDIWCAKSYIV